MPLARIITRSVGESEELARELRARGYTVETVSPEQISEIPADLEIKLQECSPEEALTKAGLVPDNDLCVFIAPGALAGSRPIAAIPLIASAREDETATPRVEFRQAAGNSIHFETEKSKQLASPEHLVSIPLVNSGAAEGLQSALARTEAVASEGAKKNDEAEVYVYQDAVLSPLQRLRLLPWPRFSMRMPRPSWRLPRWSLPRFSVPRVSLRLPRLTLPRPSLRLPRWTMPRSSSLVPGMKLHLPSFHMPQVGLRIPQVKVRLPHVNWRIARPQWRLNFRNSAALLARVPRLQRPSIRLGRPPSNSVFWETAVAFGILAVSVMLVGGLVHRRAPLSADLVQRSVTADQKVPFAKLKPAAHSASTDSKNTASKNDETRNGRPQLAAEKQKVLPKPAPAAPRPAIVARKKPSAISASRRRSTTAENDEGYVAEDVVVHYSNKGRQDVASGTKSGLSR
jgi:hypothetical protein